MPSQQRIKEALALIESDKSKILGLTVGSHTNVQPGQHIPRADAQAPPTITSSFLPPSNTYLVISLDLDAPFVAFPMLGPILHWIQPHCQISSTSSSSSTTTTAGSSNGTVMQQLSTDKPFIADYIGPAPPRFSGPHRYVFMVYEQPEGLDVKKYAPANGGKMAVSGRMRYDLDKWAKEIGLGKVLGVNYFTSN